MFSIWQMRRPKLTGACTAKRNIIRTCKTLKGIVYQTQSLFHVKMSKSDAGSYCQILGNKIVYIDQIIQSIYTIFNFIINSYFQSIPPLRGHGNHLADDHCLTSCAGSDELHWCLDIFLNEVNVCLCILWKIFKGLASGQITKVTIKLFVYWLALL